MKNVKHSNRNKPNPILGKIVTHLVKTRSVRGEIRMPNTTLGRAFKDALCSNGVVNVVYHHPST